MTTKKISYLFTIFSAMFAGNVHAAPTGASGIIRSYYLSGGSNYSFRISLYQNGADQLSGCNSSFAYVNANDDNYQAKVSGLMLAYSKHCHFNSRCSINKLAKFFIAPAPPVAAQTST